MGFHRPLEDAKPRTAKVAGFQNLLEFLAFSFYTPMFWRTLLSADAYKYSKLEIEGLKLTW